MKQLVFRAPGSLALVFALGALGAACAKKEPKPLRTEPWLAHPPPGASAAVDGRDAGVSGATRYSLSEPSVIRFEISSRRGPLRGSFSRVSGELSVALGDLAQSRGQVRVDLSSLAFDGPDASDATTRARAALELSDAGPAPSATFDLSELSDVSPAQVEPTQKAGADRPYTRRARFYAVGKLLLHGFRVLRRVPLEAEFGFTAAPSLPSTLVIRSRAPFVISLETHAIRALRPESVREPRAKTATAVDEVHVTIELYGRKVD